MERWHSGESDKWPITETIKEELSVSDDETAREVNDEVTADIPFYPFLDLEVDESVQRLVYKPKRFKLNY